MLPFDDAPYSPVISPMPPVSSRKRALSGVDVPPTPRSPGIRAEIRSARSRNSQSGSALLDASDDDDFSATALTSAARSRGAAAAPAACGSELRSALLSVNFCSSLFALALLAGGAPLAVPWTMRPIPGQLFALANGTEVFIRDATFDFPYLPETEQTVPTPWLIGCIPCLLALSFAVGTCGCGGARIVPGDAAAFVHGALWTFAAQEGIVGCVKKYVGWFRPFFYGACGFQGDPQEPNFGECLEHNAQYTETEYPRASFPSGHSSAALSMGLWATLFLLGRARFARGWVVTTQVAELDLAPWIALGCFAPTFLAVFVASSRVVDNAHGTADALAGSLIGCGSALFFRALYYPGTFSEVSHVPRSTLRLARARRKGARRAVGRARAPRDLRAEEGVHVGPGARGGVGSAQALDRGEARDFHGLDAAPRFQFATPASRRRSSGGESASASRVRVQVAASADKKRASPAPMGRKAASSGQSGRLTARRSAMISRGDPEDVPGV
jgi:membrane-associated phospholipid phosphatase